MKEVRLSGRQWTIVVSKNYRMKEVGEAVSPSPSLLLQGDMGMGGSHSLLVMYILTERQTRNHDWYRGKNSQKSTRGNFSNYGNKLVAI